MQQAQHLVRRCAITGQLAAVDGDPVRLPWIVCLQVCFSRTPEGCTAGGRQYPQPLLRDLAVTGPPAWADSLLLLVAPVYNADGK